MSKSVEEQIGEAKSAFDLAEDFDGSCPCADFELSDPKGTVYAHSRCWRISKNDQDLYVWGNHPELKKIAKLLKAKLDDTEWYNPYTLIFEEAQRNKEFPLRSKS